MKEEEVNKRVEEWLTENGYSYKGVMKSGDVPVPDGKGRNILIDAQGSKLVNEKGEVVSPLDERFYETEELNYKICWIEGKGSNANFSELLEGFIRVLYAVWHGGGLGLLAVPNEQYEKLMEEKEFLEKIAKVAIGRGRIGIMNISKSFSTLF
jgi:hypothetical protein